MNGIVEIARAFEMAARLHAPQTRKGAAGEPYVNHVAEVAAMLAEATGGEDPVLVIGGLLHDVLEDAPETPDARAALAAEIDSLFGAEVLALVEEVTDRPAANEAERWQNQIDDAVKKSLRGKLLKIADKTSNLQEIVRDPPPGWDREKRLAYVEWGKAVVDRCRGLNRTLEAAFDAAYAAGIAKYSG